MNEEENHIDEYWSDDEKLAFDFLAGRVEEINGKVVHNYLSGNQELAARSALLRLLRSHKPLNTAIRWRLAALLDPGQDNEDRKFTLENRYPGQQSPAIIEILIGEFIERKIADGCGAERAKEKAEDHFDVSESTVDRAWRAHKATRDRNVSN